MGYLEDLVGRLRVSIEDVSADYGMLAVQGPRSREILATLAPEVNDLAFFGLTPAKIGGVEAAGFDFTQNAYREPGAGEWWRPTISSGSPSSRPPWRTSSLNSSRSGSIRIETAAGRAARPRCGGSLSVTRAPAARATR